MALFAYEAFDEQGGKVNGEIDAATSEEVVTELKKKGLYPLAVKSVESRAGSIFGSKVNLKQLEFFTSELSLLLNAGVKIDKAIDLIRRTKADPALSKVLTNMAKDLNHGYRLEQVFANQEVFDDLYCNLVAIGESSGKLPMVFSRLASNLKFKREMQSRLKSALVYPLTIFVVCVLAIVFILNFVIPRMAVMFEGVKVLPWYTELMLAVSAWMQQYQLWVLLVILASLAAVSYFKDLPAIVATKNRLRLSLPLIKMITLSGDRIRYTSALSMMLASGVSLDRSMQLATDSVSSQFIKNELKVVRTKVNSGGVLSQALSQTSIFPEFYTSLLEVGEQSGKLAQVFEEITQRSRSDFEEWSQKITTLLEPLMILFMGLIVGGVVVLMLLSMVSVNDIGM